MYLFLGYLAREIQVLCVPFPQPSCMYLFLDYLVLETPLLEETKVHALQHERPILSFRAARPSHDCQPATAIVVLARQELLQFPGV